jgi:hypothetical protein
MAEHLLLFATCTVLGAFVGTVLGLGLARRWRILRWYWSSWAAKHRRKLRFNEGGGYRVALLSDNDAARILGSALLPYGGVNGDTYLRPRRLQSIEDEFAIFKEAYLLRSDDTDREPAGEPEHTDHDRDRQSKA